MIYISRFRVALARLCRNGDRRNAIANVGWLSAEKFLRLSVGLIVGALVARHLGPEKFGLLSYLSAIILVAGSCAGLGLHNVTVRDIVRHPDRTPTIVGTSLTLQVIGGACGMLLTASAVSILRPNDSTAIAASLILAASLPFKGTDAFKAFFEAHVRSKYVVAADLAALIIASLVRVSLVLLAAPFMWFAAAVSAETVIAALALTFVFSNRQKIRLAVELAEATRLLHQSWPLVLSSVAALLYMRLDQIMLGQISGDQEVGIYSAAVRLSEIWYFAPVIIAASVFPRIIQTREVDKAAYYRQIEHLLRSLNLLAFSIAIPVTIFSQQIIVLIYGDGYKEAADVLVIHVWTAVFVFQGVIAGRWFVTENLQRLTLYRTIAGLLVNIALNFLLIPRFGVTGAAFSSVAAQATASVLFNIFSPSCRPIFALQIRALSFGLVRL